MRWTCLVQRQADCHGKIKTSILSLGEKCALESESGKYSLENKGELVQDGDISGEKRWGMGSNSLPPPRTNVVNHPLQAQHGTAAYSHSF